MEPTAAFFYGTLMAPEILHRVLYGPNPTQPPPPRPAALSALLPKYTRHRVQSVDYPGIIPDSAPKACVRGSYVTDLTPADIWRLDLFEGNEYERVVVRVKVGDNNNEEKECWTYVWIAGEEALEKEEWDFDDFRREKMHRWVGGSSSEEREEYQILDEAGEHDPTGGRSEGGAVIQKLEKEGKLGDTFQSAV